jgi:hypothetical protein
MKNQRSEVKTTTQNAEFVTFALSFCGSIFCILIFGEDGLA